VYEFESASSGRLLYFSVEQRLLLYRSEQSVLTTKTVWTRRRHHDDRPLVDRASAIDRATRVIMVFSTRQLRPKNQGKWFIYPASLERGSQKSAQEDKLYARGPGPAVHGDRSLYEVPAALRTTR
jgi:hypothetical protein